MSEGHVAPDLDGLQEELKSLDLEGAIPDEIKNLSDDSDEETKGKAAQTFAKYRGTLNAAKGVISQVAAENKELKEKLTQASTQQAPSTSSDISVQQAQYAANLKIRAMQNVRTLDPDNPLLLPEINRLYSEDLQQVKRQAEAEEQAESIVENTLSEFSALGDEDKAALKESMASWSALDKANPDRVKREVHTYLGANLDKFKPSSNGQSSRSRGVAPGAAAASQVKATGNRGVTPKSSDKTSSQSKPATPEELKEMRQLGLTTEDIEMYRAAKKKSGRYQQSG